MTLLSVVPGNDAAKEIYPNEVSRMNVYPPRVGEIVAGVGFPKTALKLLGPENEFELGVHPIISSGSVRHVYHAYRDKGMLDFPCFQVATHAFSGMSGGPIYNEQEELCGVVCAAMDGHPIYYGVSLWPLLFTRITHDQSNIPLEPAPYFAQIARNLPPVANLEEAIGRHHLEVDEDTGRKRLLLRSLEEYELKLPKRRYENYRPQDPGDV